MPVRLFSGARSSGISFNMLHRPDLQRVKQQYYCPAENRVVERSEIVKGYEFRKDEYVVVEPEEIKKIEPQTAKTMEILEFVKASDVDPVYFESSYYMVPDEAGRRPYALLAEALEESDYVAIAKLTMHNREYTVFLRPHAGGMMLHTMYYAEEVRQVEGFGAPDVELKDAEVKVAHQLIEALATDWDPEKYHDTFQDNLKKLIQTKLEGGKVVEIDIAYGKHINNLNGSVDTDDGPRICCKCGTGRPSRETTRPGLYSDRHGDEGRDTSALDFRMGCITRVAPKKQLLAG